VLRPVGRLVPSTLLARSADAVAPDLVGKILWREGVGGGRLTEVEAYLPQEDPACHAFRGMTKRNRSMFGPPGTIYVYLSYGIHVLLNLVCDEVGLGAAVLVRSFEPLGETAVLRRNRGSGAEDGGGEAVDSRDGQTACRLSCGPGRVGQALGLTLALDGLPLGERSGLYLVDDGAQPRVERAVRVGIRKGDQLPLRFFAADSAFVTHRGRRSGGLHEAT